MTDIITIPGATELVGRGVYRGFPNDIPEPVRDRNAIVAGEAAACARAARPLGKAGWRVTVVTHERCRCGLARMCGPIRTSGTSQNVPRPTMAGKTSGVK